MQGGQPTAIWKKSRTGDPWKSDNFVCPPRVLSSWKSGAVVPINDDVTVGWEEQAERITANNIKESTVFKLFMCTSTLGKQ
jgi:hypothetical protein